MAYRLPSLTAAALLAALVAATTRGQEGRAGEGSAPPREVLDGSQFVLEASRRLMAIPLSADVNHQVHVFGQTISGGDGGRYVQLGRGDRVRFELKFALGNHATASLVHVCNGEYLYVRRALPGQTVVTRLRLETVYDAMEAARESAPSASSIDWLAIGGVPRLLQLMHRNFDFSAPRSGRLGQRAVWVVEGKWKPEVLANFLPQQRDAILAGGAAQLEELAPQVPTGVVLALAADGEVPLFPVSIDYRRRTTAGEPSTSLVSLRFENLRRREDLTPDDFKYEITEQVTVVDLDPAQFIRGLGLEPARR